jgi:hypothetical protein
MKKTITAFATVLLVQTCMAQKIYSASEAAKHVGENATVCDSVYGGRFLENSSKKITLINMGAAFPNQLFTIVLAQSVRENLAIKPEIDWKNNKVCATGSITLHKDKPQIEVNDKTQLEVKK